MAEENKAVQPENEIKDDFPVKDTAKPSAPRKRTVKPKAEADIAAEDAAKPSTPRKRAVKPKAEADIAAEGAAKPSAPRKRTVKPKAETDVAAEDAAKPSAPRKRTVKPKAETDIAAEGAAKPSTPRKRTVKPKADDAVAPEARTDEAPEKTEPSLLAVDNAQETATEAEVIPTINEDASPSQDDTGAAEPQTQEGASEEADEPSSAEDESGYTNIEHFSDFYEKKYKPELESILSGEDGGFTADGDLTIFPSESTEYENLTILEPTESIGQSATTHARKENPDDKPYDKKKPRRVDSRFELLELIVFTFVVIMLINTFFFKHSVVDGSSMESGLHGGDHLIISDFFYEPEQYDIVVVHDKTAYPSPVVKRVIATEGQTVRLERVAVPSMSKGEYTYYTVNVYVDGAPVSDDFVYLDFSDTLIIDAVDEAHVIVSGDPKGECVYEYLVPEGEVYVLGDHRNVSQDSRAFGSVKVEAILGKVLLRIFPFEDFGTVQ